MNEVFEKYKNLFSILVEDVITAEDEMRQSDTQFRRRNYIRAVFALIEGDTFRRKQTALISKG